MVLQVQRWRNSKTLYQSRVAGPHTQYYQYTDIKGPSEAHCPLYGQFILRILFNTNDHCHVHNNLRLNDILSQMNSFHMLRTRVSQLLSPFRLFCCTFVSLVPACYMSYP